MLYAGKLQMAAGWFYFSFGTLYLTHMREEYWTGFTHKLPPPRLVGSFAGRGFWGFESFPVDFRRGGWRGILDGSRLGLLLGGAVGFHLSMECGGESTVASLF